MRPRIRMPRGEKRPSPAEIKAKAKSKMAHPKRGDPYMEQVINLVDEKGNFLFRGTRKECLRYARETFEERRGYPRDLW